MRIAFDNSVHLGQFSTTDEALRLAAKNSQAMISLKPGSEIIGIEAFNENTYSDDIIWTLDREPQDTFYKFMDVYHSVTNILRVPLTPENAELALGIHKDIGLHIANALTCAVAILNDADEIHSFYHELKQPALIQYMREKHRIAVTYPRSTDELRFSDDQLESYYQGALATFRAASIHLPLKFHT
jgi:hypothetical protein